MWEMIIINYSGMRYSSITQDTTDAQPNQCFTGLSRPHCYTVEPLYYKVLVITNEILPPSYCKIYGKEPQYNKIHLMEHICQPLRVLEMFIIFRFHSTCGDPT